jgi:hypothetical protein
VGDLNETFRFSLFCSCPSADVPSFVEIYPKIKYPIFDRPHNWKLSFGKNLKITELKLSGISHGRNK